MNRRSNGSAGTAFVSIENRQRNGLKRIVFVHDARTNSSTKNTVLSVLFFITVPTTLWIIFLMWFFQNDSHKRDASMHISGIRLSIGVDVDVQANSLTTSRETQQDHDQLALFYHTYVPLNNESESTAAISIIVSQLNQTATSYAAKRPIVLHYNVIGYSDPLIKDDWMGNLCQSLNKNLSCKLMGVYESGAESITLMQLQQYCIDNPSHRVSYLHSKGTYHWSQKNENWRQALTDAALSEGCVNPPNRTCNLCGVEFYTQFTFFVPGNMFTAHCQYIRKLLPFDEYQLKREEAVRKITLMRLRNQLKSSLIWDQRDYYGLDRYADEHWVGSHPDVVPCDMDPLGNLGKIFLGETTSRDFEWAMAPRPQNSGICNSINEHLQPIVRSNPSLREREILLLPGNIIKWYTLYNQSPADDSWVWDFFPDGDMWRNATQAYGEDAVDILTKKYKISLDGESTFSAFAPSKTASRVTSDFQSDNSTNFAIFYHISLSKGVDFQEKMSVISDQLQIIKRSYATNQLTKQVLLYYTLAGSNSTSSKARRSVSKQMYIFCNQNTKFKCKQLPSQKKNYEGETVQSLYSFCQSNDSHRVVYLHNQGPVQLRYNRGNEKLIRHLTMAVTSELCLNPPDNTCNVCGLVFYMLWTFFFPGNMFAASCSYIKDLVSPKDFESKMTEYIKEVLLMKIRVIFQTKLFPDRIDYFGLDRHALDHWVGSHPSFKPCDLSGTVSNQMQIKGFGPKDRNQGEILISPLPFTATHDTEFNLFEFWRHVNGTTKNFHWNMTPIRIQSPLHYDTQMKDIVLHTESFLRREYYLLAGKVHRWLFFYKHVPSSDSWIWTTMPDGNTWLKGYEQYGDQVVEKLTEPFADDGLL